MDGGTLGDRRGGDAGREGPVRVAAVEVGKRGYVEVVWDDGVRTELPEELVVRRSLVPGTALSSAEREELREEAEVARAKERAISLLARRMRTEAEVRRALRAKGFSPEVVRAVVRELKRQGYLDDRRYAETYVELRTASSPRGRWALFAELRKKGVDREIADAVLRDLDSEEEYRLARSLAERRLPRLEGDEEARRMRLARFLLGRGFSASAVLRVLEEWFSFLPEGLPLPDPGEVGEEESPHEDEEDEPPARP
ncbi:MAG: regulatory protein RecX [Brockia lithotrophica]|nr:regulatory protein RecX [Brockia lithotrophica]